VKYTKRRKWKYLLHADEKFETGIKIDSNIRTKLLSMDEDGTLLIKTGYAWDGASGPTFDSKNTMLGSLIHDAIYQLMREGWLDFAERKQADELLRDIMISKGMTKFRARIWYRAVRKAAHKSARSNVLTA
jgi:hypothetical protein